ncbi:MAG: sigma-70 family RNA polymerase sigma factor [Terracidiphilus sp.]
MPESDGDEPPQAGSFDELVEQHSRMLFRIALSVLRRVADAEDAVQEAFLEVCRNKRWEHIDNPRAYLAQVVWRIAIRQQSKRRREQELTVDIRSGKPGPEQQAIGHQLDAWLHAQIDALPDKLRHPLVLTATGDLKQVEIARLLGLPEGTVRRRVHDARARLRQKLEARKGEEHERED